MTDSLTHSPDDLTQLPRGRPERKRLLKRFPGVLSAVARKLGCRPATVGNVYNRHAGSARIERALLAEFNRRAQAEREAQAESREDAA